MYTFDCTLNGFVEVNFGFLIFIICTTLRRLIDLRACGANTNCTLHSRNKTHGNDISNINVNLCKFISV